MDFYIFDIKRLYNQNNLILGEVCFVKIDMHCHTKYGSIDAKVRISEYVKMLSAKGYDGTLVTDHDSYRGYNRWKIENPDSKFRVIRGVEYDTRDAGHLS